jgi:hypothetical protein
MLRSVSDSLDGFQSLAELPSGCSRFITVAFSTIEVGLLQLIEAADLSC